MPRHLRENLVDNGLAAGHVASLEGSAAGQVHPLPITENGPTERAMGNVET